MKITIAHSPDPDDAFMHYALLKGKIDTGPYQFEEVVSDIESLNHAARAGCFEVTALSIHAYAYLFKRYALLNHGASMGEGYGPMVVSREPMSLEDLAGQMVAIPGFWTTAALTLGLAQPEAQTTFKPFDKILQAVASGNVVAGVVIHEGQLTYEDAGLQAVCDLGVWWAGVTGGLPLPLGGNAIRRDLGPHLEPVSRLLRASIEYGLAHPEEALSYAERFGRGLDRARAERFVQMYVNSRSLDYGEDGRQAVRQLLQRGAQARIIPQVPEPEFLP
ncbi:MAG: MqnA/MqnD/SBP family protein [Planctomycetota bacterium]